MCHASSSDDLSLFLANEIRCARIVVGSMQIINLLVVNCEALAARAAVVTVPDLSGATMTVARARLEAPLPADEAALTEWRADLGEPGGIVFIGGGIVHL